MDENKEIIEEEVKVEETETIENEEQVSEEVQETSETTEEETQEEENVEEHKEGVEGDDSEAEAPQEDNQPDVQETEEVEAVEEVPTEPEKSERELELEKQLAEFEVEKADREAIQAINNIDIAVSNKATEIRNNIVAALEATANKYGIPLDKTMEELEKENPTMAKMAAQIRANAEAELQRQMISLQNAREMETAKVVFQKASRLFEKYELTPEQEDVAAQVFANMVSQVGINDLDEDLKAKVKLAAAQAKYDVPVVVQKEETDTRLSQSDTTVLETPTEKIETVEEPKVEEKVEVPPTPVEEVDIEAFEESATEGKAQGVASVNEDNVLEKMAALPFKERTAFYREHIDLINEVMRKRR